MTGVGEPNFLGYEGAGRLSRLCREAMNHRDFERVRALTHTIHLTFVQEDMPFIPSRELDRFVAASKDVQFLDETKTLSLNDAEAAFDPLHLFKTAKYWNFEKALTARKQDEVNLPSLFGFVDRLN